MVFVFRVDIDSAYGMRNGVPKILEMLRQLDLPASFFVVMGGETGIFELVRQPRTNLPSAAAGVKLPKAEIARILLAPYNFAEKHADTLRSALREGHEVGCHGWKHREWSRSLERLDLDDRFQKITSTFERLFGFAPASFTAPAFKANRAVLEHLDKFGFQCAGDLDCNVPFKPIVAGKKYNHVQVPVTLKDKFTRPLIEGLCFDGYSDSAVIKTITAQILQQEKQNGFSCFYCHDVYEGINKLHVLKEILQNVKKEGIKFATMQQAAKNCREYKNIELN